MHHLLELVETQRTVVEGGRKPEAILHKVLLAGSVAAVHTTNLGYRHVALVDEEQEVLREEVEQAIRPLARLTEAYDRGSDELVKNMADADVAETAAMQTEGFSSDPKKELDDIESRLNKLARLKKKYGPTLEDVVAYGENAKRELDELSSSELLLRELGAELKKLEAEAAKEAALLHRSRTDAAAELERLICDQLAFLDMRSAVFKVDVAYDPAVFARTGSDSVEFLLSANRGEEAKPLANIASGGELARIMLGIKSVFAEKEGTQTLIYDEIDTGISGKTAQKLGLVLKKCAESAQVLCVTHSAQIAAAAQNHLLVSKAERDGRVMTDVRELYGSDRVDEVARIMGGNVITDKLRASAQDLINETIND